MPPTAPAGSHGNDTAPNKSKLDEPLAQTEPTSGPAGSSYEAHKESKPAPQPPTHKQTPPPTQHAPGSPDQRLQAIMDSGFQARAASRPGRDLHDIKDTAQDLGSKAKHGLKTLSGSQIALGVGVLAAAAAFFLTKGKRKYPKVHDQRGGRHQGKPTGHQPHTPRGNDIGWRSERPRGGVVSYGRGRVQAGSGFDERRGQGPRRDQGPADGRRYDPRIGGRQNPDSPERLGRAY